MARTGLRYTERYVVPWWFWPVGLACGGLLAAEFRLPWPVLLVPYLVVAVLVLVGLWWIGRVRVTVTDTELRVAGTSLPLRSIAGARELTAADRRRLLGVDAHPLAFVAQRPWVGGTVRVDVADPGGSAPYWLLSTRHPARLLEALAAATPPVPPESGSNRAGSNKAGYDRTPGKAPDEAADAARPGRAQP